MTRDPRDTCAAAPAIPGPMQLPPHVLAEAELRARLKRRGHAGQPGTEIRARDPVCNQWSALDRPQAAKP